jgi:hypothetical protein
LGSGTLYVQTNNLLNFQGNPTAACVPFTFTCATAKDCAGGAACVGGFCAKKCAAGKSDCACGESCVAGTCRQECAAPGAVCPQVSLFSYFFINIVAVVTRN